MGTTSSINRQLITSVKLIPPKNPFTVPDLCVWVHHQFKIIHNDKSITITPQTTVKNLKDQLQPTAIYERDGMRIDINAHVFDLRGIRLAFG